MIGIQWQGHSTCVHANSQLSSIWKQSLLYISLKRGFPEILVAWNRIAHASCYLATSRPGPRVAMGLVHSSSLAGSNSCPHRGSTLAHRIRASCMAQSRVGQPCVLISNNLAGRRPTAPSPTTTLRATILNRNCDRNGAGNMTIRNARTSITAVARGAAPKSTPHQFVR